MTKTQQTTNKDSVKVKKPTRKQLIDAEYKHVVDRACKRVLEDEKKQNEENENKQNEENEYPRELLPEIDLETFSLGSVEEDDIKKNKSKEKKNNKEKVNNKEKINNAEKVNSENYKWYDDDFHKLNSIEKRLNRIETALEHFVSVMVSL